MDSYFLPIQQLFQFFFFASSKLYISTLSLLSVLHILVSFFKNFNLALHVLNNVTKKN